MEPAHPADPLGRCQRLAELGLDLVLGVVAELEPVSSEELDSVVLVRVVRGGYHGGQVEPMAAHQQRRGRSRQHAAEQRVATPGGNARGERRLEHFAGLSRVPHDQHLRPLRGRVADRGARDPERQLGGQEMSGAPTDPVRAEKLASHRRCRAG